MDTALAVTTARVMDEESMVIPQKAIWLGKNLSLEKDHHKYWAREMDQMEDRAISQVPSQDTLWNTPYGILVEEDKWSHDGQGFKPPNELEEWIRQNNTYDCADWRILESDPVIGNYLLYKDPPTTDCRRPRQPGQQTIFALSKSLDFRNFPYSIKRIRMADIRSELTQEACLKYTTYCDQIHFFNLNLQQKDLHVPEYRNDIYRIGGWIDEFYGKAMREK